MFGNVGYYNPNASYYDIRLHYKNSWESSDENIRTTII